MSVLESENVDIMSKKFFYEVWFSEAEKAEIEGPLIAQGIEQGIERGQHQALMTAARNMLQQGFDIATIAKCLSIDEEEVQRLQKDLS